MFFWMMMVIKGEVLMFRSIKLFILVFRFNKEEIGPVLFDWRQSRGFDKGSIHVNMGQLRI